ncbi:AfsR/SARP family transcriptional regulator [Kribbella catacumbae]|uniref:AfsR/SARP family transcriptional regulator n=1 Tax=Kribbella catacumbae TaxID=460086 RepID=UPI000369DDBC|nr:BTAD domain-containing putative transcriptional regulator [Kribbella catacumbae]
MELRFRVLGPTEVRVDGVVLPLKGKRLRALLTTLLVQPNTVVTIDNLIEQLWAGEPPANPEPALHTAVSRLRAALGPAAELIKTVPGGYRIEVSEEQLDLTEFRALVAAAEATVQLRERADILTRALDLWRDVPWLGSADDSRDWLIEDRLRAMEKLVDARLALGEHAAVIAELTLLTKQHPLRERGWIHLMLALYRSGRQADALAAYRELTKILAEELGVEPAIEVRELHRAILTGDVPAVGLAAEPPQAPEDDGWHQHWQLPMDLIDFVGRDQVISEIIARLKDTGSVPVAIVSGAPGVGKSALAVHLGHQLRAHFPDGHWHVRLAGASGSPREPLDVLGELLGLAGIDPYETPADLERRAALLRSTLADRRVLLVLDDARDARQVVPLLPGTAGNAVLVTSRNELTALSVAVGARGTRLAMLDPIEATDLLSGMLGAERVMAEPAAAVDLAEICGRLPLALRIAAGLLKGRPDQSIAEYAEELRTGDRLAGLAIGDEPDTAVAAAFALSYESLKPPVRRLFALLGVIPGGDFTAPAAAALLDCPPREVGALLEALVSINLVQRERGRYRMHDLIRLYSAARADSEPGADDAWLRLASWYLRTTDAAADFSFRPYVRLTGRLFDDNPFADANQTEAWLAAEEPNLVAVINSAAEIGPYDVAWRLADVLRGYFVRTDRVVPWRYTTTAGLKAALAAGDRGGEGAMRHSLATLLHTIGDLEGAVEASTIARERYAAVGFGLGEAALLCNLGMAIDDAGRPAEAVELLTRGIKLFRDLGETAMLAPGLHSLSNVHYNLGELDSAVAVANEALEVTPRDYDDHISLINRGAAFRLQGYFAEAEADLTIALTMTDRPAVAGFYELSWLYADLARFGEAESEAAEALRLSRRDGMEWHEAASLNALGSAVLGLGRCDEAARHHTEAREIAARLSHRATEAEALLGLATVAFTRGQLSDARELATQVRKLARDMHHRILECRALILLAEANHQSGNSSEAENLTVEAAAIKQETGYFPADRLG